MRGGGGGPTMKMQSFPHVVGFFMFLQAIFFVILNIYVNFNPVPAHRDCLKSVKKLYNSAQTPNPQPQFKISDFSRKIEIFHSHTCFDTSNGFFFQFEACIIYCSHA